MMNSRLLRIGDVVKPHGIKGELCVDYYADSPFLLDACPDLFLAPPGVAADDAARPFALRSWRVHKHRLLLFLAGVTDRNQAEALRGWGVFAPKESLPPLDDDQAYLHELVGWQVVLESGEMIGTIQAFLFPTPEQEIWVINDPDGREILFPATPQTVLRLERASERAVVAPPPGLLDIYR